MPLPSFICGGRGAALVGLSILLWHAQIHVTLVTYGRNAWFGRSASRNGPLRWSTRRRDAHRCVSGWSAPAQSIQEEETAWPGKALPGPGIRIPPRANRSTQSPESNSGWRGVAGPVPIHCIPALGDRLRLLRCDPARRARWPAHFLRLWQHRPGTPHFAIRLRGSSAAQDCRRPVELGSKYSAFDVP